MEHPFTEADFERLKASQEELENAEQLLEAGKRAGFDLVDQETRLRAGKRQLALIRQQFFANRT